MDITAIEHASITAENRVALATHMEKFDSFEAAAVDGMALKGLMGKPFKFPESMDKLPDDASRTDFTAQAHKLLGITPGVTDLDGLKDIDLKAGIAAGIEPDENLANLLKSYAVEKKLTVSSVQDLIGFFNGPITEYAARVAAANAEAGKLKAEAEKLDAATKTQEALISHKDFGSEAVVKEKSELLRRAIKNNVGLSAEEYEKYGEEIADSMLTKSAVGARVMLNLLAPLAAESDLESGKGTPAAKTQKSAAEQDKDTRVKKDLKWK